MKYLLLLTLLCFPFFLRAQDCTPIKNKKGDYSLEKITLQNDNLRAHVLLSTFKADGSMIFTVKVEGENVCFDSSTTVNVDSSAIQLQNDNIDNCQGVFICFMNEDQQEALKKSDGLTISGLPRFDNIALIRSGITCLRSVF